MVKCIILKINVVVMMRDCAIFFFFFRIENQEEKSESENIKTGSEIWGFPNLELKSFLKKDKNIKTRRVLK